MDNLDRKAAIRAYKERATPAGIYAVICSATGQVWVGQSRHVDTQQNGLWFALSHGGCRHPDMQAAWREHGESQFRFEELDRLPQDVSAYRRSDELRKRAATWIARLQATAI